MKPDIRNRDDIVVFVDRFYSKVQKDYLIGPIFNGVINEWAPHLEKMYSFWNSALFAIPGFKGNPFAKHAPLPITAEHFERWLLLFDETIDTYFEGEMAADAKKRAGLMASMFLVRLQNMKGGSNNVIV